MTKKSDAPAIRFKGFSDAWEQRKLGEIGSVSMCRRIFKEQTSETGDIPFIRLEHLVLNLMLLFPESFLKNTNLNILILKKVIF